MKLGVSLAVNINNQLCGFDSLAIIDLIAAGQSQRPEYYE